MCTFAVVSGAARVAQPAGVAVAAGAVALDEGAEGDARRRQLCVRPAHAQGKRRPHSADERPSQALRTTSAFTRNC